MENRYQLPQSSHRLLFLVFLAVFGARAFAGDPAAGRLDVTVRGWAPGDSVPVRGVYLDVLQISGVEREPCRRRPPRTRP